MNPDKESKTLKSFGIGLGIILGLYGAWARYRGYSVDSGFFAAAALSILTALIYPRALYWVYRPWMKVMGVIGAINTFLLLGIVYYGILTPYNLVVRLLGIDLLDQRLKTGDSYWKDHEPPDSKHAYTRQY